jgi:hypothetical protein
MAPFTIVYTPRLRVGWRSATAGGAAATSPSPASRAAFTAIRPLESPREVGRI